MTTRDFVNKRLFSQKRPEEIDTSASDTAPADVAEVTEDVGGGSPAEQEVASQQADDSDYSWAEDLAEFKDGLHGVALKDLLTALRDGTLPEALFDKIQLELQNGDERWPASITEARNGAMMRQQFSKLTAEHSQNVKAWDAEKTDFIDYVKGWKENPELLIAGMEKLGLPFDQATRLYAERLQKIDHLWNLEQQGQVPQGTTKQLWESQQREREFVELQQQQKRIEDKQRAEQETQHVDQATKVIEQASAQALQGLGLEASDQTTWKIYRRHLSEIYAQKQAMPTRQDILDAAHATKEEREQYIRSFKERQPAAAPGVPHNVDAGAPDMTTSRPRGSAPKPMSTRDWVRKNMYGGFGKR